jgi:hypothetical protein
MKAAPLFFANLLLQKQENQARLIIWLGFYQNRPQTGSGIAFPSQNAYLKAKSRFVITTDKRKFEPLQDWNLPQNCLSEGYRMGQSTPSPAPSP